MDAARTWRSGSEVQGGRGMGDELRVPNAGCGGCRSNSKNSHFSVRASWMSGEVQMDSVTQDKTVQIVLEWSCPGCRM